VKPPFIRVVPSEVDQFGPAAAIVLAHIRYRCEADGPMRIQRDGHMWWRVSRSVIGREVGLSLKVVRKALQDLGGAVAAKHFPPQEDRSLAYRVILESDALTSQKPHRANADQPEAPRGQPIGPTGPTPEPRRASALSIETLETGREAVADGHPPVSPSAANSEPPRFCPKHMPDGTHLPCTACGRCREHHDAWTRNNEQRRAAIREAIDACPDCDQYGRDWLDPDVDCPNHPNFRQQLPERTST